MRRHPHEKEKKTNKNKNESRKNNIINVAKKGNSFLYSLTHLYIFSLSHPIPFLPLPTLPILSNLKYC